MATELSGMGWTPVCRVDDIPVLGARRVQRPQGIAVAVFRNAADKVFALLDSCPHRGGPLSQGIVFGESVACPLHNWTIGLADGNAREPDVGCAVVFRVQVDAAGQVLLDAHELATLALDRLPPRAGPGASTGAVGGGNIIDVQTPHAN